MSETRMQVRAQTYVEDTISEFKKNGSEINQLVREEIELAFEAGYKAGIVDATRKESSAYDHIPGGFLPPVKA